MGCFRLTLELIHGKLEITFALLCGISVPYSANGATRSRGGGAGKRWEIVRAETTGSVHVERGRWQGDTGSAVRASSSAVAGKGSEPRALPGSVPPRVHRTDAAERLFTSKRSFKRRIMPVSPGIAKCIPNNDKMENTKRDWS